MGTKNNPGAFDCYAKAEPDEPMFVLLGRDPLGADLSLLWATLAIGDIYAAVSVFKDLTQLALDMAQRDQGLGYESDKYAEAAANAEAMRDWAAR